VGRSGSQDGCTYRCLLARISHLLDEMHHPVSSVEAVHRGVERHNKHPDRARVAGVVDKGLKDEIGIVLWGHDAEADCPCDASSDGPEGAKDVESRKTSGISKPTGHLILGGWMVAYLGARLITMGPMRKIV
jgi:hypothetical protein